MAREAHVDGAAPRGSAATRGAVRGAAISMVTILLSRVLGVVRDIVVAAMFGQGRNTDTYFAALQIPDLLFFLIAGGVLSSSFMPVYVEYRQNQGEDEAWRLFSVVATLWTLFVVVLVGLGWVFAPQLVPLVSAPGFTPEQRVQVVELTRIVLPAQVAFFTGGVLMGVQWARQSFVIPGLGPSVYNLGIMLGALAGGLTLGREHGIKGLCYGALAGAWVGNFLLQVVGVARFHPKFRPSLDWRHPGARRVLALMIPVIFSLSLPMVDVQINRWFASRLLAGAVSSVERSYRLMLLPVGIFGQAIAMGFYATLANLAAAKRLDEFRYTVSFGLRALAVVALPTSGLMAVLRVPLVALIYQHGQFGPIDTWRVAESLAWYGLGIGFWCAEPLLGRAFYALQDTRTPVYTGTVVTVAFVLMNVVAAPLATRWVGPELAHLGLAASTTLAAGLFVVALFVQLQRRVGSLYLGEIARSLARTAAATLVLEAVAWGTLQVCAEAGIHSPLVVLPVSGVAGLAAFAWLVSRMHMPELDPVRRAWNRLWH